MSPCIKAVTVTAPPACDFDKGNGPALHLQAGLLLCWLVRMLFGSSQGP